MHVKYGTWPCWRAIFIFNSYVALNRLLCWISIKIFLDNILFHVMAVYVSYVENKLYKILPYRSQISQSVGSIASFCYTKLNVCFPHLLSTSAHLAKLNDLSYFCMLVYGHNKLSWCFHRHTNSISVFHAFIIRALTVITLVYVGRIRYNELEIMGFVCCFTGKCSPCQRDLQWKPVCYHITITVSLQHYLRCRKEQHS